MKFPFVTPCFEQLDWLRLCAASVADQEGVELEHIVQNARTEGSAGLRSAFPFSQRFNGQVTASLGRFEVREVTK